MINIVDASSQVALQARSTKEAYKLIKEMAMNSYQWPTERMNMQIVAEVSNPIRTLMAQMSLFANPLGVLTNGTDEYSATGSFRGS